MTLTPSEQAPFGSPLRKPKTSTLLSPIPASPATVHSGGPMSPRRAQVVGHHHRTSTYPLDKELQTQMLQFLGEGPMRFGPAILVPPVNVREQLVQGVSLQLTTYVSLRTLSEVKKKYRRATDEQVLRIVQFCRYQDALSYDLLKKCKAHYFHLTAMDRQRDIQEHRLVVPLPQLAVLHHPHTSRVLYFRPSRLEPKHDSKAKVIDSLIYVLDNWTRHDAVVWTKQTFMTAPVMYCLLVHLQEFEREYHYTREYWSKLLALLQGRVFPVRVHMVLWVDPPPCFEQKIWPLMQSSMFLSDDFAKKNYKISSQELELYLQPQFQEYLPRDEFPNLVPCNVTDNNNNNNMTLESMARDYLLYQRYLETLQGKSDTHKSLTSKSRRGGPRVRRRRFSMPLNLTRTSHHKKKKRNTAPGDLTTAVLDKSSSYRPEDDQDHDDHDDDDDEDDDDDVDHDEQDDHFEQDNHSSSQPPSSPERRKRALTRGFQKLKRLGRGKKKDKLPKELRVLSNDMGGLPPPPADFRGHFSGQPPTLNKEKSQRRSSLPKSQHFMERKVGSGVMGGLPVKHKTPRRSSLSVLEELHEHIPSPKHLQVSQEDDEVEEEPGQVTPSQRRRRRMSLKAVLSPLKLRRRRKGGGSHRSGGAGNDESSYISDSVRSHDMHDSFNQSLDIQHLTAAVAAPPLSDRTPPRAMRRHSSHNFSHPSPAAVNNSVSNHSSNLNGSESTNNMDGEDSNSNHDDAYDWGKILAEMKQTSMRGGGLQQETPSPSKRPPPRVSRRHSATTTKWPEPPPFGGDPTPSPPPIAAPLAVKEDEAPRSVKKKPQDLSYFLEQVERSKERTRQLQLQRKAGNATVS